jgi:Kinesin motor domain
VRKDDITNLMTKTAIAVQQSDIPTVLETYSNPFNPRDASSVQTLVDCWSEVRSGSSVVLSFHFSAKLKGSGESLPDSRLSFVDTISTEECKDSSKKDSRDVTPVAIFDVLTAVGFKQSFVPYRNSVLTHLLQPFLESESKTLMVRKCLSTSNIGFNLNRIILHRFSVLGQIKVPSLSLLLP